MSKITAAITAVHGAVPEGKLTNADLEKLVDTNDEWIVSRTGIKERRKCAPGQAMSDLGAEIVTRICEKRGISPLEIDNVLMEHEAIEQVVTFGVKDKMLGESIGVAIVTKQGIECTEKMIHKGWITKIKYYPDLNYIISSSLDGFIHIHGIEKLEYKDGKTFNLHQKGVNSFIYSSLNSGNLAKVIVPASLPNLIHNSSEICGA